MPWVYKFFKSQLCRYTLITDKNVACLYFLRLWLIFHIVLEGVGLLVKYFAESLISCSTSEFHCAVTDYTRIDS